MCLAVVVEINPPNWRDDILSCLKLDPEVKLRDVFNVREAVLAVPGHPPAHCGTRPRPGPSPTLVGMPLRLPPVRPIATADGPAMRECAGRRCPRRYPLEGSPTPHPAGPVALSHPPMPCGTRAHPGPSRKPGGMPPPPPRAHRDAAVDARAAHIRGHRAFLRRSARSQYRPPPRSAPGGPTHRPRRCENPSAPGRAGSRREMPLPLRPDRPAGPANDRVDYTHEHRVFLARPIL